MDHANPFQNSQPPQDAPRSAIDPETSSTPAAPKQPRLPRIDNDLREALRAMVTVVGIEADRGEGGRARTDAAAAIGRLLGIDLVATAMSMPSAIGRAIPSDPTLLQRLITLLQQPSSGAVSRLAQAIDAGTLSLRPGFTQRLPHPPWAPRTAQTHGRDVDRRTDDRDAPGRSDDR